MVLDGEVFRTVARDAHADRLREAAADELVRLAMNTPSDTSTPGAPMRAMAALLDMLPVVPRLRPLVRRAIG